MKLSERLPSSFDLWVLLLSFGVLITGVGVLGTAIALVLVEKPFPSRASDLIQSLYYVGLTLGSLAGRHWLGRCGVVAMFGMSAAVGCVFTVCLLVADGTLSWGAIRVVQGICLAGIYISVEMAVHMSAANEMRGRLFALYQIITYLGVSAGQWLIGYLEPGNGVWFVAAALLFAGGGSLSWWHFSGRATRPFSSKPKRFERGLPTSKQVEQAEVRQVGSVYLGLCVVAVSGVLLSSFFTVFPLVVRHYMVELSDTGNYLAIAVLAALPPILVVGHIADRYGRANTMVLVALVMLLSLSPLALQGSTQMLWSAGWVYSGLVFCVYGLGASDVNDHVGDQHRERAAAAVMLLFSLGGCAGPWLSGWAYDSFGAAGYFVVSGGAVVAMLVVGVVETWRRSRIRHPDRAT